MSTSTVFSGGELPIAAQTAAVDLPVALILMMLLMVTMWTKKFQRWQGAAMLTVYVGYLGLLIAGV